ncbi:MAG: class I SAM-dependent methyltransferase [Thermodesulfobacteriota bacterium]|nr:class I SAM-dependent methyltransferase [Thermodesulfobacteriota bacterium]
MKFRTINLIGLLLSEAIAPHRLQREPEPEVLMEKPDNVKAFHDQGNSSGYLLPVHHFNAVASSKLLPYGGTLLDLGSGSGQYLMYLAMCREDIRIIGLELSSEMVSLGNAVIKKNGLDLRVKLIQGDMTDFHDQIDRGFDVISSIFSFHHLTNHNALRKCLFEIAALCHRFGCAVWTFDHVRPRLRRTARIFPDIFTPDAPEFFRQDSMNSLIAAFSFSELKESFDSNLKIPASHCCSKLMRLYQIHWSKGKKSGLLNNRKELTEDLLPPNAKKEYRSLRWLFSSDPLISG